MYQIVDVPDHVPDLPEQTGTKPKFWFQDENSVNYLFKEGRSGAGDDWSEKVASELCSLLELPHVAYKLAVWRGKRGVVCQNFVPEGGQLVHGNELLARIVTGYQPRQFFHIRQHTLRRVLLIIRDRRNRTPIGYRALPHMDSAIDVFVGYLMFDAWIANQDRHHENWALVVTEGPVMHLAPTYDHASSLGSNESDRNRKDRLTTRDAGRSMERYVERARSAFFRSPSSPRPMSMLDAFHEAGKGRPKAAKTWLESLERVSLHSAKLIFDQIPRERMSEVTIEFALKMLELNRRRLLGLYEAFR